MIAIASQITSLTIVSSAVYSGTDEKKTLKLSITGLCARNSSVNSAYKGPVTRKMFPFDDIIMGQNAYISYTSVVIDYGRFDALQGAPVTNMV